MSAYDEPDDDDTDLEELEDRPGEIQRVEVDLLTAIAADLEATNGEEVLVTNYLVVAETMDTNGTIGIDWTLNDAISPQAMLGLAHWLVKRVDEMT